MKKKIIIPVNSTLDQHAKNLRKNMTNEEKTIWYDFLNKITPRFHRQKIIGNYIVDFYCSILKIVIEIDGVQHYLEENTEYEKRREKYLENKGYKLLRFYNSDINKELKNTEATIYFTCVERAKELGVGVDVAFTEEKQ